MCCRAKFWEKGSIPANDGVWLPLVPAQKMCSVGAQAIETSKPQFSELQKLNPVFPIPIFPSISVPVCLMPWIQLQVLV